MRSKRGRKKSQECYSSITLKEPSNPKNLKKNIKSIDSSTQQLQQGLNRFPLVTQISL